MKIAIITPVFNDWPSFSILCKEIDDLIPNWDIQVDIFALDDGSTLGQPTGLTTLNIGNVSVVTLARNLGHQRAIAVGLSFVYHSAKYDYVLVMDSDGEDRPDDIGALIKQQGKFPDTIVVAQRTKRSEGVVFRIYYRIYKLIFRVLTGMSVDFGNFCLIPWRHVGRLVHMQELWNHLAGAIVRARVPITRAETVRGRRYAGQSTMSFVSLVIHGLSAISVFGDLLFVRLTIGSVGVFTAAILAAGVAVFQRLFTNMAIPGWATSVVGFSVLALIEAVTLLSVATLMTLNTRSGFAFIPAVHSKDFILDCRKLELNG